MALENSIINLFEEATSCAELGVNYDYDLSVEEGDKIPADGGISIPF